jgi:FMN phosphatase YigB (HAD superfamily)
MVSIPKRITHISFDLDDTFISIKDFDNVLWNTELPRLYAKKHDLSIEQAEKDVFSQYYKALYIERIQNWTSLEYWSTRLGLDNWEDVLARMKDKILVYDDVVEVLEKLSQHYTLLIHSANDPHLLRFKLKEAQLEKYFSHVFSSLTGKRSLKGAQGYKDMLTKLACDPKDIIHIGDDEVSDYDAPVSVGIPALLIDRTGKRRGEHVIHSLRELVE